jgi:glycosyltransferase involved in cell wall biosynthesis
MTERRASVITYYFPPLAGIGVQRTLKHVVYLPDSGWRPVVFTPRGAAYRLTDEASLADLPASLEVHRSFCYEPARLRRALGRLVRLRRGLPSSAGPRATARTDSAPTDSLAGSRLSGLWAWTVRLLFFPDDQVLWVPFAMRSAIAVQRRRPSQVLYSSSPPVTTHLIAGLVSRRTGTPWVADFRDPWIGNSFAAPLPRFQRRLQVRLERWIVEHADRVVFATEGLAERYRRRYPSRADRFVTIPNGYDATELSRIRPVPRQDDGTFHLVYSGSIYGDRELEVLVDGLALAIGRTPGLRDRLRVELIGWMTDHNRRRADSAMATLGPVLQVSGFVPRDEALAKVRSASAALLLLADGPDRDLFVGGKLYEYLGLGRQILAVAPRGDARSILEKLDWGVVADPDAESVADALERLMSAPVPTRAADPEGRYERRRLSAQLGALFDQVVEERANPAHS